MKNNLFTAVTNGHILTMDDEMNEYPDGLILIKEGCIAYAGSNRRDLLETIDSSRILDARGGIIIPGLVNTHTHIGMSLFRTLADDRADRLRKILIPMENTLVEPELVYRASLHTLTEMILGGTTTFADMYFFQERTVEAVLKCGLRAVLGESLSSDPSPGASCVDQGLERIENLIGICENIDRIDPAAAPHAPYSLTEKDLSKISDFARTRDLRILSHLAEMPFEEQAILERSGEKPVPFYNKFGLLGPRSTMAHCIFTDSHDRSILIRSETGIAHNPGANAKSGKGIAPAYSFFQEGARMGLGTDGPMSGNTMDLVGQLGLASKLQKVKTSDPTVMNPRQILKTATLGGARALHLEKVIGSLEMGKRGDIAIISTESPAMFPIYDPYSALVYCAGPADVFAVLVDGILLMHDRELLSLDIDEVREGAREWVEKIGREADSLY